LVTISRSACCTSPAATPAASRRVGLFVIMVTTSMISPDAIRSAGAFSDQ
jgi:hypothetical protein